MLNKINWTKSGAARNDKVCSQCDRFCTVTALSIYFGTAAAHRIQAEPLILQWYIGTKHKFRLGQQSCLLQIFKLADPLCVSTRKIIVQTKSLRSKRSVLWPCGGRITAAVAEVAGTAMTDWNGALFMKFWKNPEAFIRGANLKFAAKKERSTAKNWQKYSKKLYYLMIYSHSRKKETLATKWIVVSTCMQSARNWRSVTVWVDWESESEYPLDRLDRNSTGKVGPSSPGKRSEPLWRT